MVNAMVRVVSVVNLVSFVVRDVIIGVVRVVLGEWCVRSVVWCVVWFLA